MRPFRRRAFCCLSPLRLFVSSRISLHQARCFHPTRPSPFVNEVLEVSTSFLHGVHSVTGLPWVLSIPLTAFLVRMTIALPLQIHSRIHARRQASIMPILISWKTQYQNSLTPTKLLFVADADLELKRKMQRKYKDLRKRWKVGRTWKFTPYLQLPIWLSLMEALRAMCGNKNGLYQYLLPYFSSEQSSQLALEPSLATEGALWFPDLLAGDPTGVLPLMLSTSILTNVTLGWKSPTFREISDYPTSQMIKEFALRCLKIGIQCLAVHVGVAAYMTGMPTGLMIYWMTSVNVATIQSAFLHRYMFAIQPLKPWTKMYVGVLRSGKSKPRR